MTGDAAGEGAEDAEDPGAPAAPVPEKEEHGDGQGRAWNMPFAAAAAFLTGCAAAFYHIRKKR